jgi:hypothetical protein
MHRPIRPFALALLWVALGCDAPPPRVGPARSGADKAALFGDPSLVPTREGERAREEVALAHEIEQALMVLPSVAQARVDVELPDRAAAEDPRVLVVVEGAPAADGLPVRARAIAHAVTGPAAAVEVVVEPSPAPPPPPQPMAWPLVLAVLGLGFFGGMLVERIRRLRRAWRAATPRAKL